MKLDVVAVAAGLLHDVVEDTLTTPERIAELFGPEIAHVVEGRHQDRRDPVLVERGAAGRELPQDAAGDGGRHPRHPRQAGRPPAQHADAAPPPGGAAHQDRPGDARHLRADRQPPRHEQGQERARGAVVQVPRAEGVRGAARRRSKRKRKTRRRRHRRADAHAPRASSRRRRCRSSRSTAASSASTAST